MPSILVRIRRDTRFWPAGRANLRFSAKLVDQEASSIRASSSDLIMEIMNRRGLWELWETGRAVCAPFSKRGGNGGKAAFWLFHGFHGAAVSIAQQCNMYGTEERTPTLGRIYPLKTRKTRKGWAELSGPDSEASTSASGGISGGVQGNSWRPPSRILAEEDRRLNRILMPGGGCRIMSASVCPRADEN